MYLQKQQLEQGCRHSKNWVLGIACGSRTTSMCCCRAKVASAAGKCTWLGFTHGLPGGEGLLERNKGALRRGVRCVL